jgi:hypothetical protein
MSPRSYGPLFTVKVVKTQLGADYLKMCCKSAGIDSPCTPLSVPLMKTAPATR